jgi:hypothetical protein
LSDGYREDISSIAGTQNRLTPGAIDVRNFGSLADGVALLEKTITEI